MSTEKLEKLLSREKELKARKAKYGFANDSVAVSANTIKKVIAVYDGTSYNVIQ